MLAKTFGSTLVGVDAKTITVEVDSGPGMKLAVIGLAAKSVQESVDRIKTALRITGHRWPRGRLIINMAPANLPKAGTGFDLCLAIGILAASHQLETESLKDYIIMGELSLDGSVKGVRGSLSAAIIARKEGFKGVILPKECAHEAAIVDQIEVIPVDSLTDALDFLGKKKEIKPLTTNTRVQFFESQDAWNEDFSEVSGHAEAKRALEVAAAGGHNIMMIGPPGSGKSMLAKRLRTILPPMNLHEALDATKIHSAAGTLKPESYLMAHRPFRSPHHTISNVALVGGGTLPSPGEISLAHNGVLYLDELPEFSRHVLEVMRQPLEDGQVTISRARNTVTFPANFMLVASLNPCPCGHLGNINQRCICSPKQIRKYIGRISGPLIDRVDIHIEIPSVSYAQLTKNVDEEPSKLIRQRVIKARKAQTDRFSSDPEIHSNSMMRPAMVRKYCPISSDCASLLKKAMKNLGLSARAYDRIVRVARTIADLDGEKEILPGHVAEAISYRTVDRQLLTV